MKPNPKSTNTLALNGEWQFSLDPANKGISENWFDNKLSGNARLPGTLTSQGIGEPITLETPWVGSFFDKSFFEADRFADYRRPDHIKIPCWLQPDLYYAGASWFQRDIEIPKAWVGKQIHLFLERTHWLTTVWLDGKELGSNNSLSIPHIYDLGAVTEAGSHSLCIRIDNSLIVDLGINSHSITDHTQGNWNGIVGRVELIATEPVRIEEVQVYPDAENKEIRVTGKLKNTTGGNINGAVNMQVHPVKEAAPLGGQPCKQCIQTHDESHAFELVYAFTETPGLWSEHSASLYKLSLDFSPDGGRSADETSLRFGFRKIEADGNQLRINGRKLYLRGTLDCAAFPKTGHPPTERGEWEKVFSTVRNYGLNHVRFHSWCPPRAAFEVADEKGIYLQVEACTWPGYSTTIGDGKDVDAWVESESIRILECYGNHPSFVLMSSGNEPFGENQVDWLTGWIERRKQADNRRLYNCASAHPQIPENDFHINASPRIQGWGEELNSRINALPPETVTDYRDYIHALDIPVVSHEIGQWCAYPDFSEMEKYTGYLKPKNFEIFKDWMVEKEMLPLAHPFKMASGKLQTACYKEDIESSLRTPQMGGFQLLGLSDFPGQGTALIGTLNVFWEEKGYTTSKEYKRFCHSIVPLARFQKRIYTEGEHAEISLELAHYGAETLHKATPYWELRDAEDHVVRSGKLPPGDLPPEGLLQLGTLDLPMDKLTAPAQYRFVLGIDGHPVENDWNLWLYPQTATPAHTELPITRTLDPTSMATLNNGGTVLLQIDPDTVKTDSGDTVKLGFSSIFWNTSWTAGHAPTTLGILCNPQHAALNEFPTDYHSDWQWWYVIKNASPMILDDLPAQIEPVLRVVNDWNHVHRLALVFEVKVGTGRLIVCSINLSAEANPVIAQLRQSIINYATSTPTPPDLVEVSAEKIQSLYC